MDKLNRCMSENPNQIPSKYAELSEKKARPDIHQDLVNIANLTSQMQMISDSLASCHTRSRHRPMRKDWNLTSRKHTESQNSTPIETFTEEIMVERRPRGRKKSIVVNYVLNNSELLYLGKSKTFVSREEILTKQDSFLSEKQCDRFDSLISGSDISREIPSKTSKVGMYDYRKVDSGKMIEVLVRELRTLGELAPPVYFLVSNLSENFFHFRECRKCHDKISPSLPWILNRIQKLIKYVIRRRQETYLWPNDFSYLKLNTKSSVEETTESLSKSKLTLVPVIPQKVVGKLEKVDPIAIFEHSPGVQIVLEVTPELEKKKFFLRSETVPRFVQESSFPVVHFQEPLSSLVVHVLQPSTTHRVIWEVKREVEHIKEHGIGLLQVHLRQPRKPASVTVTTAEAKLFVHQNTPPCPEKEELLEEVEIPAKNLLAVLIEQSEWDRGRLPHRIYKPESNGQKEFSEGSFPPELMPEEANEEMQVQKVNELEEEVKELKDLMLEVHKNQTELGKLLMEKKVFSQLMVKLTDPKMLSEENNALRKASKMDEPSANISLVGLQMIVDNLKRKCALKNMLILTLLRGLRSNVPKELWEQVIGYVFDDSESMEEIDSDKINQIIWQASVFLTEDEKERKVPPLPSRTERLSTEEEPKVKGKVGAEVEDSLENLSCYQNQASAGTKGVTEGFSSSPARIWAFPIMNAPAHADIALRKIETQISTLNVENEKLWNQIKELRDLLQNSMKHTSLSESNKKVDEVKSSGKIVSVVIQVGDKSSRRSEVITSGRKIPAVGIARSESVTAIHEVEKSDLSDGRVSMFPAEHNYGTRSKTDRRRSQNDLNYVDDESISVKNYASENERFRGLHGLLPKTPHPSPHDLFQNFKPVSWVPSKYVIPEVYDIYGAGPSRKHGDLLQKPSLMELGEMQCPGTHASPNERDLQTIPENDIELSPKTSHGVSQAVQLLRKRVRSLHKNMSLLKSKNDQIDKLLDKLLDDVVENNHNYEDLQSSLNNLKSRLG